MRTAGILFLAGSLVLSFVSSTNQAFQLNQSPKLIVLGLDGATWNIINPLMKEGKMPSFKKLCHQGAHGNLTSMDPMRSPSLWTTIASGVSPDKHGITGFFSSQKDLNVPRTWDYFHASDHKVGLFGWLATWPPMRHYDFVIPSWFAPKPDTYPAKYVPFQELYLEQNHGGGAVDPFKTALQCIPMGAGHQAVFDMLWFYWLDKNGLSEEERIAKKALAHVRLKTDIYLAMLKKFQPDVTSFCLYGTDELGHRFWHYMNPQSFQNANFSRQGQFKDVIPHYYQRADRAFGRILPTLPKDCYIIILSDHGMKADTAMPRQFFLNIPAFLKQLNVLDSVHYQRVMRHVLLEPTTHAIGFKEELRQQIEDIHFAGDTDPVFSVEEDEKGRLSIRPHFSLTWHEDSPLLTHEFLMFGGQKRPTEELFFLRAFSGAHAKEGIVALKGPGIRQNAELEHASILDIAPTMLYMLGHPIPEIMEGHVLQEAFQKKHLQEHPIQYLKEEMELPLKEKNETADKRALMERLRSLGYIR